MTLINTVISPIDGHTPVYNPNEAFRVWNYTEIYLGQEGLNKYVPKVNDLVFNIAQGDMLIVVDIDPISAVARFIPWVVRQTTDDTTDDLLLGVGPGTSADTYRVFIDKNVTPYTLVVDQRLTISAVNARTAKIFRGSVLSGSSNVISLVYDASNNFLGNNIPLELVSVRNHDNVAVRSVAPCYTNQDLPDNEIVWAVFYGDDGHVVSKRQLLVENTAFIRSAASDTKYVHSISLKSPFLSPSDPNLIDYPYNVPLNGYNMIGVVHYSDGSTLELPVDSTRFTMMGLNNYVATIPNAPFPVTLRYTLGLDETAYGTTIGPDRTMSESYTVKTTQNHGVYSVKLFCYPVWLDAVNGYRLHWMLYNLERQTYYNVTPYVSINSSSPAFDPIGYGLRQQLSVTINLKNVAPYYQEYFHVQVLSVTLRRPGTDAPTNWTVADYGQAEYGESFQARMQFINQNKRLIQVDSAFATQDEWLSKVFYAAHPLYDSYSETQAPVPTHFVIETASQAGVEFPLSAWNQVLDVTPQFKADDTLLIRFLLRMPDTDLQLGVGAMPLKQIN